MTATFSHLLAPGNIGSMVLRNRIVLTSMGTNLAEQDGTSGARLRASLTEHAKGGAGLVMVGVVGVGWPHGAVIPWQPAISDDRFIPGLRALADSVHAHGAKFGVQLHFGGLMAMEDMLAGRPVWTPSVPLPKNGDMIEAFLEDELEQAPFGRVRDIDFHAMTEADIETLISLFAAAAARAQAAGADGVEIHAGHGYLISSFISPHSNRRTDYYGGSLENRLRLLIEIIRAIRIRVGNDFAVWCKLDSQEFGQPQGITLEDAQAAARLVQAAGVDAITVTAYHDASRGAMHAASHTPEVPGLLLDSAAAIRAVVTVPVIAAGRIEPEIGDQRIAAGGCDFIAMGRKLLADPQLPRKLSEGRAADIRPCVYCYTCISEIYVNRPVRCAVNPELGFEADFNDAPAVLKKRVAVVGGGPAGMEVARRLALKGHTPILLEQSDRLGGTLFFAAAMHAPNGGILHWLQRQLATLAVDVRLNTRATPELLRALAVDAVVVASGARRAMPDIPGAERPQVFSGDDVRQLFMGGDLEALRTKTGAGTRALLRAAALSRGNRNLALVRRATRYWMPLGRRIVIIGGELVGLELAQFLAERGRRVAVLDTENKFGAGLPLVRRWQVLDELRHLGVVLLPSARAIAIGERGVSYTNAGGQQRTVGADHVIVAKGASGDLALAEQLRGQGFSVHSVGDCNGVGYISGAMRSAAEVALIV